MLPWGGQEAFKEFFSAFPADSGFAFVIVTHLPRNKVSALPQILAGFTSMPVNQAEHGTVIAANQVYICPPDQLLLVRGGAIELRARASDAQIRPIDLFLSSLADDQNERAIGVLLSGGNADGTLGLKTIKEKGGLTVVQGSDGSVPLESTMPETAIAVGVVDIVLPVGEMAAWLIEFGKRENELAPIETEQDVQAARLTIADILREQIGHDFSGYKERTFLRRVRRRMQVNQIDGLQNYVDKLRQEPDEVSALFKDLLIGVTDFFRDPEAFAVLENEVIPKLFEGIGAQASVRIWVPGCATGEEAYSIAILLREHISRLKKVPKVQIFATDIDESALAVARAGRYPASLVSNVSPERLKRFFTVEESSYTINKEVRSLCMFSSHSVLRDPPFSRIDLVSCRNLLIYFGTDLQSKAIPIFHFALRPQGYLFLGTSENVTQASDLFIARDKKYRIFQRRDNVASSVQFAQFQPSGRSSVGPTARSDSTGIASTVRNAIDARVMDKFAPAHVIVNRDGDILHYSARTGKYLEPAVGAPNRQLTAMARRGLRLDLRGAMREALETRRTVMRGDLAVELDDRVQLVALTVEPIIDSDGDSDPLLLVVFTDIGQPTIQDDTIKEPADMQTIDRLEHELRDTKERLQGTIEEYETAVEELKSSNEELQSINEELQSTNEELETSKEELQSVNEELQTVNSELTSKVEEVDRANSDLKNVFESTQIATVFLDRHLVIRSFTPAVTTLFHLISSDRGRPLTDIVSNLKDIGDLKRDISSVIETNQTIERRVSHKDGNSHYLMRILGYHTHNDVADGALVTFVDVSMMVQSEAFQRTLVEELNHRVRNMLTVAGVIAKQTIAHSESIEEFRGAFLERLQSMGRAYTLVSQGKWGNVDLRRVINTEIRAHGGEDRVQLSGGQIACRPQCALTLGMVFHELATNSVKYGALSSPTGRVSVAWHTLPEHVVRIVWQELDGPTVTAPESKGFGLTLITNELQYAFGAEIDFDFKKTGMQLTMTIPNGGDSHFSLTAT